MDINLILIIGGLLLFAIIAIWFVRFGQNKKWFKSEDLILGIIIANLGLETLMNLGVLNAKDFQVRITHAIFKFMNDMKSKVDNEKELEQLTYDYIIEFCKQEDIEINDDLKCNLKTIIELVITS